MRGAMRDTNLGMGRKMNIMSTTGEIDLLIDDRLDR